MPGNREQHAAVGRLGNQQGGVGGEKIPVDHQMGTLARGQLGRRLGDVEAAHVVGPHAGGVDDDAGREGEVLAAFCIPGFDATHFAVFVAQAFDR